MKRDKPFPLLRRFVLYILPLLVAGALGLAYSLRETVANSIEAFHAQREAALVSELLIRTSLTQPDQWRQLVEGQPSPIPEGLTAETGELGISCLVLLRPAGEVVLAIGEARSCRAPPLGLFSEVTDTRQPVLMENIVSDGFWTTLAKLRLPGFEHQGLVAISRDSLTAESTIGHMIRSQSMIFGVVLAVAIALAIWLVFSAQRALDASFETLREVQRRMQKLLSRSATENAIAGARKTTKHDAVVMFADLRNFSGFAETSSVEETAHLVDRFVTAVTSAVQREGGDVDKLIGDGVLAWFEGNHANIRSLRAAVTCINGCLPLPRHPGIGLYRGEIIAAFLGEGERADFNILGRSVNLASRLCSVSAPNEISVAADFADIAEAGLVKSGFEEIRFKNHRHSISVLKYRLPTDPKVQADKLSAKV